MTIRNLLRTSIVFICFGYSNFVISQSNYTLINDATAIAGCHCYQLTADVGNQGGGVYQNSAINLSNSFDYKFSVFLGNNGNGADGMCFILTNNITAIGAQGGGLGYSGLPGNSLAVEYDTYQNGWDPDNHHIAIEYGGQVQHPTGTLAGPVDGIPGGAQMDDGNFHTTEIVWNATTQVYSVYFDGILRVSYTGNIVANFFANNPIVNWGWSGSTGGDENTQQVCFNSSANFTAGTNYQSCNHTIQFSDASTSAVATIQSWAWNFGDPGSGASNTSALQNPTHTFSATGTYTVTLIITDVSGCLDTATHVVTIAPNITLADVITEPLCNGGNNGDVVVTASGGFGATYGYNYSWSNNSALTNGNNVGLTAGTYNVTCSDGICSATASYSLTQPPALSATTSSTDASCGVSNGTVTIAISGGTPPYQNVTWDGIPGYTLGGLGAGTYVANFTDFNGCSALLTYKATVGTLPCGYTESSSSTNVTCFGASTGSVTLTVTGTVGTATITWTNAAGTTVGTGATVTGLPAGTYTYHYVDGLPTTFTGTVVVNQPGGAMTVSLSTVNTTCSYLNNGSAVASVTANGTPNYSYAWSAAGQSNSPTASGLSPGSITVTVTDHNSCTATATGTVSGQTALGLTVNALPDSCYQTSTGKIWVAVTGGNPNYTYLWSSGPTAIGDTVYRLANGNYTVTVTDHNSCTATSSGTINQPTQLTATIADNNVLCFGQANGNATVTPAGGNGGYSYSWSTTATTATASGLSDSTYYVTVTDAKLCKVTDSVKITQPTRLSPTYTMDSVTCNGAANGSVAFTTTGGTGAYTYSLDGGAYQASGTFGSLSAGAHTVTVKDANGCDSAVAFTIYQPPVLAASLSATINDLCFGVCDGSFIVSASGGTLPYQYSTDGVNFFPSDTLGNLCANAAYTITVVDAEHCQATLPGTITQPTAVVVSPIDSFPPSCYDGNNAYFDVTVSGGSGAGYTYSVNGGSFLANGGHFTGMTPGPDTVTVKDGNGCTGTYIITVPNVTATSSFTTTAVNELCFGGSTASIFVTVTGTLTPYSYLWIPTGATTDTLSNIPVGTYTVEVKDANGCVVYGTDSTNTITQPAQISATNTMTPVSCFGDSNACITVTPAGGTGSITNSWTNGITTTTDNPCGLKAGTYSDTLTDANGCRYVYANITVTQPNPISIFVDSVTAVSCAGYSNGAITISDTGGTPAYSYLWSQGGTTNPIIGLPVGTYTVTVTDANSCTATDSITVGVDNPITYNATQSNVLCTPLQNGSISLSVTGGAPAYQYTWSNGATTSQIFNLPVGIDSVTVTDSRGCTVDTGFVITNDSAFSISINPDTATINQGDLYTVGVVVVNNSAGNATFTWTPAEGLSCSDCQAPQASPFNTTQYTIHAVTDSGCVSSAQILITVTPQHQLYVPNAFSPNGDGINDYWQAYGNKKTWVYCEAQVFDRWGEKIFESNDIDFQWDGTYKGTFVEPGVYVYTLKVGFIDGYSVSDKGTITVIR